MGVCRGLPFYAASPKKTVNIFGKDKVFQLTTPDEPTAWMKRMNFTSGTHPKGRILHSKFLSDLFKQKSEGSHFGFLQFGSL